MRERTTAVASRGLRWVSTTADTEDGAGRVGAPASCEQLGSIRHTVPHLDRLTTVVEDVGVEDERGTSDRPLISVVVPVLNGMPWIEHQLLALSTQEVPVEWEVMVADNGSDGRDPRLASSTGPERDPRFRLVDASARRGAAAARNLGVRSARGGLLAFCDADDVVRPGWVASMCDSPGRRRPGRRGVRLWRAGRGLELAPGSRGHDGSWDSSPSA